MKLKDLLIGEIDNLIYWVDDYAESVEDEEDREKLANISSYLRILKVLLKLTPNVILKNIRH